MWSDECGVAVPVFSACLGRHLAYLLLIFGSHGSSIRPKISTLLHALAGLFVLFVWLYAMTGSRYVEDVSLLDFIPYLTSTRVSPGLVSPNESKPLPVWTDHRPLYDYIYRQSTLRLIDLLAISPNSSKRLVVVVHPNVEL